MLQNNVDCSFAHYTGEINMADFQSLLSELEQIRDAQILQTYWCAKWQNRQTGRSKIISILNGKLPDVDQLSIKIMITTVRHCSHTFFNATAAQAIPAAISHQEILPLNLQGANCSSKWTLLQLAACHNNIVWVLRSKLHACELKQNKWHRKMKDVHPFRTAAFEWYRKIIMRGTFRRKQIGYENFGLSVKRTNQVHL